jgi:tetratricopeptide (TPR) repeat protein
MKNILFTLALLISFSSFGQTASDYMNSGLEKMKKNDDYGAISDFTKAIEQDPNWAGLYSMRGLSKSSVGDNYGAISDFKKAINLRPNDPEASHFYYDNMATCMMRLKDYEGAYYALQKAIEINPGYANAYYNLGQVKWNTNYPLADCCKSWREAAYRGHESAKKQLRVNCQ